MQQKNAIKSSPNSILFFYANAFFEIKFVPVDAEILLHANRLNFNAIAHAFIVNFSSVAIFHPKFTASDFNALATDLAKDFASSAKISLLNWRFFVALASCCVEFVATGTRLSLALLRFYAAAGCLVPDVAFEAQSSLNARLKFVDAAVACDFVIIIVILVRFRLFFAVTAFGQNFEKKIKN